MEFLPVNGEGQRLNVFQQSSNMPRFLFKMGGEGGNRSLRKDNNFQLAWAFNIGK